MFESPVRPSRRQHAAVAAAILIASDRTPQTGTGKSLSIICGALQWLRDHPRMPVDAASIEVPPEGTRLSSEHRFEPLVVQRVRLHDSSHRHCVDRSTISCAIGGSTRSCAAACARSHRRRQRTSATIACRVSRGSSRWRPLAAEPRSQTTSNVRRDGDARSSSIDSNALNRIDDETDVRDSDVDAAMQHARKRQKRREKEEMKRILQGTEDDPDAEFLVSDYQDSDDDNDTVDRGDDAASPSKRRRRMAAAAALVDSDSDSSDGEGNRHGTTTDNDDEEPEVRKAGVPVIGALVAILCRHSH